MHRTWISGLLVVLSAACGAPAREAPRAASSAPPPASAPVEALPPLGDANDVRLPAGVTPRAYDLELEVDPTRPTFSGRVVIDVHVDEPTRRIVMHGRDLSVRSAVVRAGGRELGGTAASRKALGQRQGEDELVLTFDEAIPRGEAALEIAWEAPFGSLWGLYRTESEGRAYAFTQLESIEARRMFPCFDEPGLKTSFSIAVVAPKGMQAVSNQKLARIEPRGEMARWVFERTAPLPTYLVALAVGDLDVLDGPKVPAPVRLVATKGRAKLGASSTKVSADVLSALERYFARPYAYDKLDIVAIPEFPVGAMENAGLVTFRDELLLTDAGAPASAVRRQKYVVAHELAHQWFGDLVTMAWWDDLWLNEGFATWMQAKACDAAFPGFGAVEERVLDKTTALAADLLPSARPVRQKVELTDQIYDTGGWTAYQKGASVLTMLEAYGGPEKFQAGIQAYVSRHAHGTVTSRDLLAALDGATGKKLSVIGASFLDQPGVPFVDFDVRCGGKEVPKGARIVVTERELAADGPKDTPRWTLPVCFSVAGGDHPICAELEPVVKSATFDLPTCPKWIHPNAAETGYYRYGLPREWLEKLARAHASLSAAERAGLVANTWALAETGTLTSVEVLRVLDALDLGHETSRVVLVAAIDVLTDLRRVLVDDASKADFVKFVTRILGPQRRRVGLPKEGAKETDEQKLDRVAVLAGAFDLTDDASVANDLEPFAKRYLEATSVDADLGVLALRVSARAGGPVGTALSEKDLRGARTPAERVAITVALTSKRDPAALRASLGLLLSGAIRPSDVRHYKAGALRSPDTVPVFHAFVRDHFDDLTKKLDGGGSTLVATLGKTCDARAVDDLAAFFAPRLAHLEGAQRAFDEGLAEAKRCVAVRAREGGAFAKALHEAR
jgi:aminopeptidase N